MSSRSVLHHVHPKPADGTRQNATNLVYDETSGVSLFRKRSPLISMNGMDQTVVEAPVIDFFAGHSSSGSAPATNIRRHANRPHDIS